MGEADLLPRRSQPGNLDRRLARRGKRQASMREFQISVLGASSASEPQLTTSNSSPPSILSPPSIPRTSTRTSNKPANIPKSAHKVIAQAPSKSTTLGKGRKLSPGITSQAKGGLKKKKSAKTQAKKTISVHHNKRSTGSDPRSAANKPKHLAKHKQCLALYALVDQAIEGERSQAGDWSPIVDKAMKMLLREVRSELDVYAGLSKEFTQYSRKLRKQRKTRQFLRKEVLRIRQRRNDMTHDLAYEVKQQEGTQKRDEELKKVNEFVSLFSEKITKASNGHNNHEPKVSSSNENFDSLLRDCETHSRTLDHLSQINNFLTNFYDGL